MTRKQKAVAIAQDVLKRLKWLNVAEGYYIYDGGHTNDLGDPISIVPAGDAQTHVRKIEQSCQVCLLGACLLSKVRLFDKISTEMLDLSKGTPPDTIEENLRDVFDVASLALMELVFEGNIIAADKSPTHPVITFDEREAAERLHCEITEPKERVRIVMKNVIKNNGVFKPLKIEMRQQIVLT